MEINHEILSVVILSLRLIQEGQLSVSGKRTYISYMTKMMWKFTISRMTKMMWKFPISHLYYKNDVEISYISYMTKNDAEISYISYMTNMTWLTSPDKKDIKKIRILIRSTSVRHF